MTDFQLFLTLGIPIILGFGLPALIVYGIIWYDNYIESRKSLEQRRDELESYVSTYIPREDAKKYADDWYVKQIVN